jgi:hypothetical protein
MPSLDCDKMTDISSSWVDRILHAKIQLPGCLELIVLWLEKQQQKTKNLVKLEAEVGAVAKADQYFPHICLVMSKSTFSSL